MFLYPRNMVEGKVARHGSVAAVHAALESEVTEDEWGNCRSPARRAYFLTVGRQRLRADYIKNKSACRSVFPARVWTRI